MTRAVLCCFLVSFLHVVTTLVGAASSRPFHPHHGFAVNNPDTVRTPKPLQVTQTSNQFKGIKKGVKRIGLGSGPPSCEHKCYGCNPCEAIQVPFTSATNYEPEGWKCKCGPTLFTP